ncbi:small, acid-soluble spore protein tlp [Psychrobacillus glaciei]|uniref:Small, acid-soluble spore protein tlp n=1 Tax=Psychrobacillus glaciei TaxID=2283160 RepID=A0A5J6SN89_9BACI|nr:small, acid-soluble spore protein tlp [Psychrobacillus glaciei]QFF97677.1 small, acid-soluble spore protein tlp [Psychrobacillus glaciei]
MPNTSQRPNDLATNKERLKKTINNMEAAEAATEFAEGKELATIKEKNERRKESIEVLKNEVNAEAKSSINGYI